VRERLQQVFGSGGDAYIVPGKPHLGVRSALFECDASDGWSYEALQKPDASTRRFYLTGFNAVAHHAGASLALRSRGGRAYDRLEVAFLKQPGGGRAQVLVDGSPGGEIDLDGAYAVEGPDTGPFSLDHSAPDALWPSVKLGAIGIHDTGSAYGAALGFQIGPKLPVASGAHGLGVEGLMLAGGMVGRLTAVLNLGGFVDPAPDAISGRPIGLEVGLDLQFKLDHIDRFQLTGELGGTHFFSSDPDQLQATLGFVWSARPTLDLSITGLLGSLSGGDRYGLLLGVSPKLRLFK